MRNKNSKKTYLSKELARSERKSRKMSVWSTQSDQICKLVTQDGVLDSVSNKANCLNDYFVNIGSKTLQSYGDYAKSFLEYMPM